MNARFGLAVLLLVLVAGGTACGRKKMTRSGPLRDWVVGNWVRTDDLLVWQFKADGDMTTTGQIPIAGSWSAEEPATVKVLISGANAQTTGMQLGVAADPESQSLELVFRVEDDEMRVVSEKSDVLWRKSAR